MAHGRCSPIFSSDKTESSIPNLHLTCRCQCLAVREVFGGAVWVPSISVLRCPQIRVEGSACAALGEMLCPVCRYNIKVPRYSQMIAALTWMSHSQNLRRMAREHPIDLYMQPPVTRFRLLDYHLMDRIVRDSNRCAAPALPMAELLQDLQY